MAVILADLRSTVTAARPGNLTVSLQSLQAGLGMGLGLGLGGGPSRSLEEVHTYIHTYCTYPPPSLFLLWVRLAWSTRWLRRGASALT